MPVPTEELDVASPDRDSASGEEWGQAAFTGLSRIRSVRLLGRGAFIRDNAKGIAKTRSAPRSARAGFRASTVQDAKTGLSSQ